MIHSRFSESRTISRQELQTTFWRRHR